MCLTQEEIVAKFVWLGKKLGLVQRSKDNTDENKNLPVDESTDVAVQQPIHKTASVGRPASSFPTPPNVGQLGPPFTATPATMFAAPTKQPAMYRGSPNNNSLAGQDSPITKRAVAALSTPMYK